MKLTEHLFRRLDIDLSSGQQTLGREFSDRAMLLDAASDQRLSECGFVALIVPPASITDQIDEYVLAKSIPILECQTDHPNRHLRMIRIDMEDRCFDRLCDICTVSRGSPELGRCGESNLIIDDHMNGPVSAIPRQLRHVESLVDHPLSGQCRISMDQQGNHRSGAFTIILQRSDHPLDHRTNRLEVTGVGSQRHVDRIPVTAAMNSLRSEVILHIP